MTTEHVLRIPRTDLGLIRVTCKHKDCGRAAEMSVRDAATTYYEGKCPFCGGPILPPRSTKESNPFGLLIAAWRAFDLTNSEIEVEFVLATDAQPAK